MVSSMDIYGGDIVVLLWSIATCLLSAVLGESLTLHTPKQSGGSGPTYVYTKLSKFGFTLGPCTSIVFEVKACTDVYVALMQEDDDSRLMYEILFGGWVNTQSVIRTSKLSRPKIKISSSGILSCTEFRKFKVGWKDGNIAGYIWKKPCKWELLMQWYDLSYSVNYIGVTNGYWGKGDWIIYNEGCYEQKPDSSYWRSDIDRQNALFSSPIFIEKKSKTLLQCAMTCQMYSECCYFTYNENGQDCRGLSSIKSPSIAALKGTGLWKRL